jgi:hypothetical protein
MPTLFRGAHATAKHRIAAAAPHVPAKATPPQLIRIPKGPLSMWGNDQYGNCVTAEEFFAKACDGFDMGYHKAVVWAKNHWAQNGAGLWEILTLMQTQGIYNGSSLYCDGPFKYVDYTNAAILRNAISQGPVKIGIAADQLENVVQAYGLAKNGWVATGFTKDTNLDHCTSLCGYGTFAWVTAQLGVKSTALPAATPVYAMFTWSSIGIIDAPSLNAICGEAWVRLPTTVTKPNPVL